MDERVEALLADAREARRGDRPDEVLARLREASARSLELGEPEAIQVTGWRLAKGLYDFGEAEALLEVLDALLAQDDPFEHYPKGVGAAEPIARRIWDRLGYRDDRVLALWEAWSLRHRRLGDPWLASQGDVQRAWHLACRGAIAPLTALQDQYQQLSPARFGRGPTKHPDARDTTLSLYWVQADLSRIVLRAATWADRPRVAAEAEDLLRDALATSERPVDKDRWVVDALCRAADRFDRIDAPWKAWRRTLDRWEPTHPAHVALGRGVLARRRDDRVGALASLEQAASLARERREGFEWEVDALVEAQRLSPTPDRAAEIEALRERSGVGLG